MVNPNSGEDVVMGDVTRDPKEIKLNYPKAFSGKREALKKFLQGCKLYLLVNKKTYDNDLAKITFVLAWMNNGDAAAWKEQYLEKATTEAATAGRDLDLGPYTDFDIGKHTITPYPMT